MILLVHVRPIQVRERFRPVRPSSGTMPQWRRIGGGRDVVTKRKGPASRPTEKVSQPEKSIGPLYTMLCMKCRQIAGAGRPGSVEALRNELYIVHCTS